MDEAALIARSQKGDVVAFNQLVELHQQAVYNTVLRLLGSIDDAADVTQECFFKSYKNIEKFRGGSLRAWLIRIALNEAHDLLRSRKRRPQDSLEQRHDDDADEGVLYDSTPGPEEEALRHELHEALEQAMLELPMEQRAIVILCDVQGFSYEEAAQATEANLGTVKSRLARGRAHLREALLRRRELLPREYRLKV